MREVAKTRKVFWLVMAGETEARVEGGYNSGACSHLNRSVAFRDGATAHFSFRLRSMITRITIFTLFSALWLGSGLGQSRPAADLILTHAKIWTGDKRLPAAEALAIIDDRIVAVGRAEEIESWRGDATKVIDAHG